MLAVEVTIKNELVSLFPGVDETEADEIADELEELTVESLTGKPLDEAKTLELKEDDNCVLEDEPTKLESEDIIQPEVTVTEIDESKEEADGAGEMMVKVGAIDEFQYTGIETIELETVDEITGGNKLEVNKTEDWEVPDGWFIPELKLEMLAVVKASELDSIDSTDE